MLRLACRFIQTDPKKVMEAGRRQIDTTLLKLAATLWIERPLPPAPGQVHHR